MLAKRLGVTETTLSKQERLGDEPLNNMTVKLALYEVPDAFAPHSVERDGEMTRMPKGVRRAQPSNNGSSPGSEYYPENVMTSEQGDRIIELLEELGKQSKGE
jgi:hypothetical protein